MTKFNPGDKVRLSDEGSHELPRLRRKVGVITDLGSVKATYVVEWGRYKQRWLNHEDSLEAV